MIETYRPSGRFSPMIFGIGVVLAAVAAGLGVVYQLIVEWIPLIYIEFVATVGFAFAMWYGVGFAVRQARCRNVVVAVVVGVIVGCGGLAGGWWWAYTSIVRQIIAAAEAEGPVSDQEKAEFLAEFTFTEYIKVRAEEGWTIGRRTTDSDRGMPIKGAFVYLLWLVEAGVLIGGPVKGAVEASRVAYCERTDEWADAERMTLTFPDPAPATLERIRNAVTLDDLLRIDQPPGDPTADTLVYTMTGRPDGQGATFLTISHVTVTANKKGEATTNTKTLWRSIVLPDGSERSLEKLRKGEYASRKAHAATDDAAAGLADLADEA